MTVAAAPAAVPGAPAAVPVAPAAVPVAPAAVPVAPAAVAAPTVRAAVPVAPATAAAFGTRVVRRGGQALDAVLGRQLAGAGITEPQWAVLTMTVLGGGLTTDALVVRVASALKVDWWAARERIAELAAAGLVRTTPAGAVEPTEQGRAQWHRVRAAVTEVTEQLWGDLPEEDLAAAGRVLATVLARADALLTAT